MRANPNNVRRLAEKKFDENHDLRRYLKWQGRLSDEQLDALVSDIARRIEADFDCATCANCCKELAPAVTDAEANRLASRLGLSVDEFRRQYLEDPREDDAGEEDGEGVRRPVRGRPCPFLKGNRCSVDENRPEQCRKYPYLYEPDFSFRTLAMMERTFTCPIVYEVFEALKAKLPWRSGGRRQGQRS